MHCISLFFKEPNYEILEYQRQYSSMFRKIYSNMELMCDTGFKEQVLKANPLLDVMAWDSCIIQVKMKREQHKTNIKKKTELLKQYNDEMDDLNESDDYYQTNHFYLKRKIIRLEKRIERNSDIVFGGRELLRNITYSKNIVDKLLKINSTEKEKIEELKKYEIQYKDKKDEFRDNRILPIFIVGKSAEKGNRKIDFNLTERVVTYKPAKGVKFELAFKSVTKKNRETLAKLQHMIDECLIPITVNITAEKIDIMYDNELVNGYAFDAKACKSEQKTHITKEVKKEVWIKHKREQESRMLDNKLDKRFAAVDLNPERVGFSIMDSNKKVIFARCYDLTDLIANTEGNNTDDIQFNLSIIYKEIFKHCKHFKVSHFVCEILNFKHDQLKSTGFNRKAISLWCRSFQAQLILKYTQNMGILFKEINPAYSSFVGNLLFDYYDPIAASLEVARRGLIMCKKLNEEWYPSGTNIPLDNSQTYVLGIESITEWTTIKLYKRYKSLDLGYRRLGLPNSKIKLIKFNILFNK